MNDPRPGRREFLATTTAAVGVLAGCAEPRTENVIEGESSRSIDREDVADAGAYADLYDAVVDAVTQVRVFGVEDPVTGSEGRGQGSGFLLGEGFVVTNEHVVAGGDGVDLQYSNGDWTGTTLLGTDAHSDLAVLEPDHVPEGTTPLSLIEDRPVVGQEVAAIGNPFGLEGSMTRGIVSGVERTVDPPGRRFSFVDVVQTDAAVNPGNSGGPLVDLDGTVVGVVNATGGDNVGFAVSAAVTERVVPELVENGEYEHAYVGIEYRTVDRLVAEENGLSAATGVIVADADGPAAGVLEGSSSQVVRRGEPIPVGGDVIRSIDGEPIPDHHALSTHLALETSPGDEISVGIVRDGDERTVDLTLGSRSDAA